MRNFLTDKEIKISKEFLSKGYTIQNTQSLRSLNKIKSKITSISKKILGVKKLNLNFVHKYISKDNINDFRLEVIKQMNAWEEFGYNYYSNAPEFLSILCNNELMMQKNVNISIQLPNDETSLLPIHSDVWSGDSPYEINLWIPLVDCYRSKSMYILEKKYLNNFFKKFKSKTTKIENSEKIYSKAKKFLKWLKVDFGKILIFNQGLPHGNIINVEKTTRWSMNCRFKSLFSPYGDKKIAEFFLPITTRAMTKSALEYKFPFIS